jgi:CheY-like chemotaxis protein
MTSPSGRILVVDDHADTARSLAAVLESLGYSVQYTTDPRAVLGMATRHRPQVVFLDIAMPHLDGFSLAGVLKRAFPAIYVVAVSGQAPAQHGKRDGKAAFDAYLAKPADPRTLQTLLNESLKQTAP